MKDIRLVQIDANKIGLFTRPQGMIPGTDINAGPGHIGFTVIDSLQQLTVENILAAKLLADQFIATEWGGVNEAQTRSDRKIAVLGHVARFDEIGNRHYYPVAFLVDPISGFASTFEILFERRDLVGGLDGESKRIDLKDVVFAGGFKVSADGKTITIYCGGGDAELHIASIPTPAASKAWLGTRP